MQICARRWLAVAPLVILLSACGGDDSASGGEFSGSVTDSAGISVVHNSERGLWGGQGWPIEEQLTIGEASGNADYQFGQVMGVDAMSDGRIAVLDQQAQHVRIYGADGVYQQTIGGPGGGPGEFSPQAAGLFVGRGDTLVVPDMGNQRMVLIPPSGEPSSAPMRLENGIPLRFDMSEAGRLVAQVRPMSFGGEGATGENDLIAAKQYDGTVTDTLLTPRRGSTFEMGSDGPKFNFFSAEPMWAMLGGDRLAYASNDAFRVSVYDDGGTLERIVTYPHERRAVTEGDQRVVRELLKKAWDDAGVPPQAVEQMMGGVSFAEFWPAFTQLRGGPEGTLWVQRLRYLDAMSEEELETWNPQLDQGSNEWDVFEADGRYGGVLTMPDRFTPLTIKGDRMFGVYRDDFDIQYVRIYRLNLEPAAPVEGM